MITDSILLILIPMLLSIITYCICNSVIIVYEAIYGRCSCRGDPRAKNYYDPLL